MAAKAAARADVVWARSASPEASARSLFAVHQNHQSRL